MPAEESVSEEQTLFSFHLFRSKVFFQYIYTILHSKTHIRIAALAHYNFPRMFIFYGVTPQLHTNRLLLQLPSGMNLIN